MNPGAAESISAETKNLLQMAPEQGLSVAKSSPNLTVEGLPVTNSSQNLTSKSLSATHSSHSPSTSAPVSKRSTSPSNEKAASVSRSSSPSNAPEEFFPESLSFIYRLKKEELEAQMLLLGLPAQSTVKEMRQRLSAHIKKLRQIENPTNNAAKQSTSTSAALLLQTAAATATTPQQPSTITHTSARCNDMNRASTFAAERPIPCTNLHSPIDCDVMNTVRKWNLHFNGAKSILDFIESIEELADCYRINYDQLLLPLNEIFRERAKEWWRYKKAEVHTWLHFKEAAYQFFLPPRYLQRLEEDIIRRRQTQREKAKDYILGMLAMIRQHPRLCKENQIDRIYEGLRPEYRLYIRRSDFHDNADALISLADEYEHIRGEETRIQRPHVSNMVAAKRYSRDTHCWSCGEPEHKRKDCRGIKKIFCSYCGQSGVLTRNCCRSAAIRPSSTDNTEPELSFYRLKITCQTKTLNALIDTGASLTFVGAHLNQYLQKNIRSININQVLQLSNSKHVQIRNCYSAQLRVGTRQLEHPLYYLPGLQEDMVIRMDLLKKLNCTVNIAGRNIKVTHMGSPAQFHMANRPEDSIRQCEDREQNAVNHKVGLCKVDQHAIHISSDVRVKQRSHPRKPAMRQLDVDNAYCKGTLNEVTDALSQPVASKPAQLFKIRRPDLQKCKVTKTQQRVNFLSKFCTKNQKCFHKTRNEHQRHCVQQKQNPYIPHQVHDSHPAGYFGYYNTQRTAPRPVGRITRQSRAKKKPQPPNFDFL